MTGVPFGIAVLGVLRSGAGRGGLGLLVLRDLDRLVLGLLLIILLVGCLHFDAALHEGAIFHADALGDDIAGQRSFAANIKTIAASDVALNLAHDHDFASGNVCGDAAVSSDGNAVIVQVDGALDFPVHIKRFGSADFALDHQRAADGRLLSGSANRLYRRVGVLIRGIG
jgi:hypothetical protein